MKPESIKVRKRHRQEVGDLTDLKQSIQEVGLLHPIVVTKNGVLVAGQRRLEACKQLGIDDIPVRVVSRLDSATQFLKAERDENTCRLDMTPSEKVALGQELEKLERPAAEERSRSNLKRGSETPEKETLPVGKGGVRERIGDALGISGPTYQRAKAVVQAAEEDPEKFGDLKDKMDETGKVSGVHDELQARRRSQNIPRPRNNGRERVGSRTVKQAVSSLKAAAINVDSAAAGFDMESYGDLALLAPHPEAQEWVELLADASRRLAAHVRTLRRYQKEAQ